ncbi:hypothetical protein VTJ04DRAFT_2019 [Mycothermus thermophilus]|uniref:uncharacterized protein n=1 Tax=Humicola insolens TaxID=85995 RepID=UPI003742783E
MASDYPGYAGYGTTEDWSYAQADPNLVAAGFDPQQYVTIDPAYLAAANTADYAAYYSTDGQVAVSPQSTVSYTSYVTDGTVYQTVWDAASSPDAGASYQVHSSKAKDKPFRCDYCSNTYSRQCDLDKHMHNHTKRRRCDLCPSGGAETKDLNRHMWAHHPDEARRRGIPREEDTCPVCGVRGRKDNIKRHKDTKGHW